MLLKVYASGGKGSNRSAINNVSDENNKRIRTSRRGVGNAKLPITAKRNPNAVPAKWDPPYRIKY